ncbi:UNVERIFIED_CONTAM: protein ADP-ribosyltransferase PARP3 [Sesamum radiatum]|uniref:Protein ADP-ribosyltransferase PARP3 n=1 Tax=Sesamum radiatum TaxID=300843 RepID=A0AAW2W4Y5_SESRA
MDAHFKVHETRSHAHSSGDDERKITRKQKAEGKTAEAEAEQSPKKAKIEDEDNTKDENGQENGKSTEDIKAEFEKFCKATSEHLSIQQMREILEANGQDAADDAVVPRCQDILFYGPLDKCPVCGGNLEVSDTTYICSGAYSEWSSCTYTSQDPPRRDEPIKLPDSVKDSGVADQYWKSKIEKHGGKVANSVIGATCLVVSPVERERGGSSKVAEAMERGIPIVKEAWLSESIEKKETQPLDAFNIVSDRAVAGRPIPLYQQDASEEALETLTSELKMFGKRSVHKDSRLQDEGGQILEKDGILYNCAFAASDRGRGVNELVMRLSRGEADEWENVDNAIKEFAKQFQGLTGNEFETWEREKKIEKKQYKLFPIDIDDGVEVRHGGLGLRQLGIAAAHCKLDSEVANFMKVLCGQEIYRYALMEMGLDFPDLPLGEEILLEFVNKLQSNKETGQKGESLWSDFSQRMFTLMPSTRPYVFRDFSDIADHGAAAFETVRDINVASRLIGDMSGATLDDPLFDRYKKLGCSIAPVGKDTDDYKMVANYLEKHMNLSKLEKLHPKLKSDAASAEGFLPAVCFLPVPGYMLSFISFDIELNSLEEKKLGVVGLGRKQTDESEHFTWKDDIKVPCGKLIPSEHKDSRLEYNEYAVYDPQQVSICFLVAVRFEEKDVEYDTAE